MLLPLHGQYGGFYVRFLKAQVLDRRIDVLMTQRLLSPEDVPAQRFINPVRKSLSHAMRGDLARQFVRLDSVLQDSMILDPADRPVLALSALEDVFIGGQDRPSRQLIDPFKQSGLRFRMQSHGPPLDLALAVRPAIGDGIRDPPGLDDFPDLQLKDGADPFAGIAPDREDSPVPGCLLSPEGF